MYRGYVAWINRQSLLFYLYNFKCTECDLLKKSVGSYILNWPYVLTAFYAVYLCKHITLHISSHYSPFSDFRQCGRHLEIVKSL